MRREGESEDAAERKSTFAFVNDPDRPICPVTEGPLDKRPGDELRAGTNQMVRVYVAQKRKIMEGDKMAGRHGNKGVVSKILPEADMPFLPDGTPVDIILNPLGVPSRMNIGQILEMHLGLVGKHLGTDFENPIFSGAREPEIYDGMQRVAAQLRYATMRNYIESEMELPLEFDGGTLQVVGSASEDEARLENLESALMELLLQTDDERLEELGAMVNTDVEEFGRADKNVKADLILKRVRETVLKRSGFDPVSGKCVLKDGRTGESLEQPVATGQVYMMKLHHLVEDKIHARFDRPVLAGHAAAVGRKSAVWRSAFWRNGSVGAGSLWRGAHAARDFDHQIGRRGPVASKLTSRLSRAKACWSRAFPNRSAFSSRNCNRWLCKSKSKTKTAKSWN